MAQAEMAGERGRLGRDPLLHVAVGGDRERVSGRRPRDRGWLKRAASIRSASAIPTDIEMPWPSGPVVASIPGAVLALGMAGASATRPGGSS